MRTKFGPSNAFMLSKLTTLMRTLLLALLSSSPSLQKECILLMLHTESDPPPGVVCHGAGEEGVVGPPGPRHHHARGRGQQVAGGRPGHRGLLRHQRHPRRPCPQEPRPREGGLHHARGREVAALGQQQLGHSGVITALFTHSHGELFQMFPPDDDGAGRDGHLQQHEAPDLLQVGVQGEAAGPGAVVGAGHLDNGN